MSTRIEEDIRQNELLTVKEVAIYLRVSRVTVWRWCQQGVIPASQVGRSWRIRRDDLLHLLIPDQLPADTAPVEPEPPPENHSKPEATPLTPEVAAQQTSNDQPESHSEPEATPVAQRKAADCPKGKSPDEGVKD
jgi:excisionase family DNA binding protein